MASNVAEDWANSRRVPLSHQSIPTGWRLAASLAALAGLLLVLFLLSRTSFALFHALVEVAGVGLAWGIFAVVWNARPYGVPFGITILGAGYLCVGTLDLIHFLAFMGPDVIPGGGTNLAGQLWLSARFLEAAVLILVPLSLIRPRPAGFVLAGTVLLAGGMAGSILFWDLFPDTYQVGSGTTAFKVVSEYVLAAALTGAGILYWTRCRRICPAFVHFMIAALVLKVISGVFFASYLQPDSPESVLAHLLRALSIGLTFKGVLMVGLHYPLADLQDGLMEKERELRQTELERSAILDNLPYQIILQDLDHRITWANEAACRRMGLSRPEMIGRFCHEVWGWDERRCGFCSVREARDSGRPMERIMTAADNKVRYVKAVPLRDREGRVTRILESVEDITDRVGREQRYAQILETILDGFWLVRMDGVILEVNKAAADMLGYTPEELRAKSLADIEGRESPEESAVHLDQMRRIGYDRFESRHRRKDGSVIDVEVSAAYVRTDEECIVAVIRDITERRRLEQTLVKEKERLQGILDTTPDHVAVLAPDGTIEDVNEAWIRFCRENGGDPAAMGRGASYLEAVKKAVSEGDTDAQRFLDGIRELLAGDRPSLIMEYPCHSPDKERWFRLQAIPMRHGHGRILLSHYDMTASKQAEQSLARSEVLFRGVVDATPYGVVVVRQGRVALVNPTMEDMTGYSAEWLMCHSLFDLVHPDDLERVKDVSQEAIRTGVLPDGLQYRIRRQDGEIRWFEHHYSRVGEYNDVTNRLIVVSDITERRKTLRALEVSEERYRSIVSVMPDMLYHLTSDLRVIHCHTKLPYLLPMPVGELPGRSVDEFLTPELAWAVREKAGSVLRTGRMEVYDSTMMLEGRVWNFETRLVLCGKSELLAIVRDVTEFREATHRLAVSEARYNAVVNDQTDLVCRFTPDGTLTFVNQAYCRFFGFKDSELLGRSFLELIPESDRDGARGVLLTLGPDNPERVFEHRVDAGDGSVRWMEWHDRVVWMRDGKVLELQSVGRDVTERKALESLLLEASEREKTKLGTELHDGLCQDLKSVEMEAALLESLVERKDPGAMAKASIIRDRVNQAVRNAYSLARDLLPGDRDSEGFAAALRDLALRSSAQSKTTFRTQIEPRLSPPGPMHAYNLYRIAQEAVNNAIHHGRPDEIVVSWRKNGDEYSLTVRDNGRGMTGAAPVLKGADRTTAGMGMAVMRARAQALGGHLDISSEPDKGTTVRCTFRS